MVKRSPSNEDDSRSREDSLLRDKKEVAEVLKLLDLILSSCISNYEETSMNSY
ncbi:hypothetical protein BB561_000009 [Smittium simulii]|uniref:Uncharacterized protein n=1 Tax=Smittium simulii TaxID=133385 RepID=A0A2T9Z0X5_9FUNG|nr:hypothetical protein BB561_000009 [Smittium simulii]